MSHKNFSVFAAVSCARARFCVTEIDESHLVKDDFYLKLITFGSTALARPILITKKLAPASGILN